MQRYHGLDALRAFAMMMGVVIHAPLAFTDEGLSRVFPGAVAPEIPLHWDILILWIHQWRMPLFFLLAGFFAMMVVERRGHSAFLKDRFWRIGVPLLVFVTVFTPIGDKDWSELHHLWFLQFLMIYCVGLGLIVRSGVGREMRPLLWLLDRPWRMLILVVPFTPWAWWGKEGILGQVIPERIWEVPLQGLGYYAFFFGLGIALWHRRDRVQDLSRPKVWLALAAFSFGILATLVPLGLAEREIELAMALLVPAGTLAIIFAFIGGAQWAVRRGSPWLTFLVDSSYAVYLVHLYVIYGISGAMIAAGWPADAIFAGSITLAFVVSTLVYVVLVRYTPVDWLLAGYDRARFTQLIRKRTAQSGRP